MPVLTVGAASDLLINGSLDGRFAAVSGFWYEYFLPCPYQPHIAPLAQRCGYGVLVDQPLANPFGGNMTIGPEHGLISPAMVTESAGSFGLTGGDSPQVVVIIHVADSRLWQCAVDERAACQRRPVLDRMVSVDGQDVDPAQFQPDLPTTMTLDEANAAALAAAGGGQVVLAYPLDAKTIQDVDPRFTGQGSGVVWYARVITGEPDANGSAAGEVVLIDDATGAIVATVPLAVDPDYAPARVVVDWAGFVSGVGARPRYSVLSGNSTVAGDWLDTSPIPLTLAAGDYVLRAYLMGGFGPGGSGPPDASLAPTPSNSLGCDLPLTLEAGANVAYYVDLVGGSTFCKWKPGEWPFN